MKEATHNHPLPCESCDGTGVRKIKGLLPEDCRSCDGLGWFGINPELPIPQRPGLERVPYFQVRYASGCDIFSGKKLENAELI